MFELHERLAADTATVATLGLSRVLLMNDRRWPWLILVPERPGTTEIHQLSEGERGELMAEITKASRILEALHAPDKINVGALGNMVPQLHIHVIARTRSDPAWPGPVWGYGAAIAYEKQALADQVGAVRRALSA
jgi:diadenosine tetraphosphate (Ap4A) HIT family hydrolase